LDEHGVNVPDEVLAKFNGYLAPSPIRATDPAAIADMRWQPSHSVPPLASAD
jgi:hypothetical protein